MTILAQVIKTTLFGDEEVVGERIRKHPIVLLGHAAIEAAQTALQMTDAHPHLVGRDGCGERAVHIAHHHHQVGPLFGDHRLEADHDVGHLRIRTARPDVQETIGDQAELLEEHVGHVGTEVLAGVYDAHINGAPLCCDLLEPGDLDEIGARAHHDKYTLHPNVLLWLRVAMMNSVLGVSLTFRAGAPAMVQNPSGNEVFTTELAPMAVLGPTWISPKSLAPGPM